MGYIMWIVCAFYMKMGSEKKSDLYRPLVYMGLYV